MLLQTQYNSLTIVSLENNKQQYLIIIYIEDTTETLNKAYQVLSEFINNMHKQVNN